MLRHGSVCKHAMASMRLIQTIERLQHCHKFYKLVRLLSDYKVTLNTANIISTTGMFLASDPMYLFKLTLSK